MVKATRRKNEHVPMTNDQIWEQNLRWLARGHTGAMHSRDCREPPEGMIRLQYLMPDGYLYVKPEWVKNVEMRPVTEPAPLWTGGPMGRDGPIVFLKDGGFARITPASAQALEKLGVKAPPPKVEQGRFAF